MRRIAKALFTAIDLALPSPPGPRVLIYHQIGSQRRAQTNLRHDVFGKQLRWLRTNMEIVTLDEAIARWTEPNSDRLAVVTFDDGYLDVYQNTYPLLTELEIPFTVYVTTSPVETQKPYDEDGLARPLTWDQLSEMAESGLMTMAAHTHTHPDLRKLQSKDVEAEIEESDSLFSERLGFRPLHFAYPYGYWSKSADQLVRSRYESAVLGATLRIHRDPDKYLLHRYPIQQADGFMYFKSRLSGGLRSEELIRRRIRGYDGP